jgi:hypothetical protein
MDRNEEYSQAFAAAAVLVTTVVSTLLWTGEAADVKAQNTANPSQDTTLQTQAPKQEAPKVIERLTEKEAMRDMTDGAKRPRWPRSLPPCGRKSFR